jgi:serine/threonine protein kinase
MGEVYLAEDSELHRNVVLKVLPSDVSSNHDRMRRFKQEATAAAALNHPNIAHIYEIGEAEGVNFRIQLRPSEVKVIHTDSEGDPAQGGTIIPIEALSGPAKENLDRAGPAAGSPARSPLGRKHGWQRG